MLVEIIAQITAVCALGGTYPTTEIAILAFEKQAECQSYYARCMRKKFASLEWDHMANCMAERGITREKK